MSPMCGAYVMLPPVHSGEGCPDGMRNCCSHCHHGHNTGSSSSTYLKEGSRYTCDFRS